MINMETEFKLQTFHHYTIYTLVAGLDKATKKVSFDPSSVSGTWV